MNEIMTRCKYCGITYFYSNSNDPGSCGSEECIEARNNDKSLFTVTDAGTPSKPKVIGVSVRTRRVYKKANKKRTSNAINANDLTITPLAGVVITTSAGSKILPKVVRRTGNRKNKTVQSKATPKSKKVNKKG